MTLLLGFGAVNTGNNLLYLLVSALLGFMAISGLLGHWNLKNIQVTLEPPDEIYAGLETLMRVRLYNPHRLLPIFLLDVYFDAQASRTGHLSLLKKGQREPVSVPVTFSARGEQQCQLLTISSSFPINFFVRRRVLELSQSVIVFPRPLLCRPLAITNQMQSAGALASQTKGMDGDISHIGNYQGTEPLKMIHWKLSARHDSLKTKELSNLQHPPVQIDLLTLPGAGLEQQLRCAAFLINDLTQRNQPVGLKMGEVTLSPALGLGHKLRLLKELAIYAQD
ncbi:MAG: DUF58 domain-containing protein [Desulfuromonadaceae bacterium]|nr:DUF58 domain-containing protein [Desulfuromonas sp.]MDY0184283.1 DUF58 domain-containing protein [Desulfuromonadaceae bacterium]